MIFYKHFVDRSIEDTIGDNFGDTPFAPLGLNFFLPVFLQTFRPAGANSLLRAIRIILGSDNPRIPILNFFFVWTADKSGFPKSLYFVLSMFYFNIHISNIVRNTSF